MYCRDVREAIIRAALDPESTPLVVEVGGELVALTQAQMKMWNGKAALELRAEKKPLPRSAPKPAPVPDQVPAQVPSQTEVGPFTPTRKR